MTQACCRILLEVYKSTISYCSDLAANEWQDVLPKSSNGSVLITSRSRQAAFELVGEDEHILEVKPMSERYALALFRRKLQGEDNENEVLELLQNLDYMPLAISQAAAYIRLRAPRTTVSKYLNDLRRSEKVRAILLNVAVRDRRRDGRASNSVLGTLQVSFEYIRSDRPSAARLLSLMSFFDRQGIPEELITSRYEENNNIMNFEEDIKVLRNYSLVALGIENDMFEMHPLVQFAIRKWLEQRQEMERWKETYIAIIADAFPPGRYENWKRYRMLFPHAVLVLEYQPIKKSFLRRWTAVLSNAAWYAAEQGRYNEAEQMDRRALDGREKVLGNEHPDTLISVSNLALVLQHQGKYDEAEQVNRRALDGREKVLGKEHPDTLTSVSNLVLVLRDQGKYDEAEQINRRALDGREKVLGKEHPDTLTSVSNLASVLQHQGKYDEAEQVNRRALDGREKVLGKEHPDTLTSVSNLASVLQHQGKYDEAEQINRRALDSSEKVLGKEHPHTLMSVNNLGNLYKNQGKMAEAEAMYIRALKGYEKAYGAGHPSTLDTVNNLGLLYYNQGKMAEAEAMYMRALKGKEKAWGTEHTSTLDTVNNLAVLYSDQGKMAEAEVMYMRALKGKEKAWGVEHTSTLNTVNNLGLLYSTSISACSPDSDSSETASIASAAWSDSSKSSVSSSASDALAAGLDETTEFFLSDEELRDLFAKAFTSQNREKVLRNGVRLLKWLGRRLVISAKTTVEKETAEFFLSRRHGRSIMNRIALQIPENPTVKRTQGQIAQHQLQKHLQQLGETPSVNVGPREPSTLKTIPSFPNDVESENSTDSEDEQQIGEEKEKLNFDAAKSFLKSSDALARLKEELGDFISPFSGEAIWKKVLWIGGQQVHFELPETASQMTRINELKLALEEHLKMPIVWWPLKQPRKWLSSNRVRMILPCVS